MASPAPSAQDKDPFADRRASPRVPVALPAFVQADGERHSVQLLDLSAGGAKLICSFKLSTGTAVTLDCGTLARTAVVRWQNEGVLGMSFDSELDEREILALMRRSKALAAWRKDRDGPA
jgi:hypothetical protein